MNRWNKYAFFVLSGLIISPLTAFAAVTPESIGSFGVTATGGQAQIKNIGDINGDSYEDVLITNPTDDSAYSNAGKIWIIYGHGESFSDNEIDNAVIVEGAEVNQNYGTEAAAAGDVNGDGYDDFFLSGQDEVVLVYGGLGDFETLTSVNFDLSVTGDAWFYDPAGIGDIDNDGYDDVAVVAVLEDEEGAQFSTGMLVLYGQTELFSTDAFSSAIDLRVTDRTVGFDESALGSITALGDVNGDGYDDFIADDRSDYASVDLYIVYGSAVRLTSGLLADNEHVASISCSGSSDYITTVVAIGDINADGYNDFTARGCDGSPILVFGSAEPLDSTGFLNETGAPTTVFTALGDVNGDGYADILYTDSSASSPYKGEGYVVYGNEDDLETDDFSVSPSFIGEEYAQLGYRSGTITASDVNGDNHRDILFLGGNGEVYIYYLYSTVEIANDLIDNDNDGLVDEINTGTHPRYSLLSDLTNSALFADSVRSVVGTTDGDIIVTYVDGSQFLFDIFPLTTTKNTLVKIYPDTAYVVALAPSGRRIATVDPYTGTILSNVRLAQKAFNRAAFKIKDVRNDGSMDVVVTAKKLDKVRVSLLTLDMTTGGLTKTDSKQILNASTVAVKRTITPGERIVLRDTALVRQIIFVVDSAYKMILE